MTQAEATPSQRRRALKILDVGATKEAGAWVAGRLVGAGYITRAEAVAVQGEDAHIDAGMRNPLLLDEDLDERIAAVLAAYDNGHGAPDSGIAKHTRRKILHAILWNMQTEGSATVLAAVRSIAEDANCDKMTVRKHVNGLIDAGLLVEAKAPGRGKARYVRLADPEQIPANHTEVKEAILFCMKGGNPEVVDGFSETMLEAWAHRELGETGRRIYDVLTDDAKKVGDIVEESGVSKTTAYKKLPKMAELGLAQKMADGWVAGDGNPEHIPNAGFRKRQRQHAKDREQWATALPTPEKPCGCPGCNVDQVLKNHYTQMVDFRNRQTPEQLKKTLRRQLTERLRQQGWSEDAIAANFQPAPEATNPFVVTAMPEGIAA